MIGQGFKCDQCGAMQVIPGMEERTMMHGRPLPREWIYLAAAPAVREALGEPFEVCSWSCAVDLAQSRTTRRRVTWAPAALAEAEGALQRWLETPAGHAPSDMQIMAAIDALRAVTGEDAGASSATTAEAGQ